MRLDAGEVRLLRSSERYREGKRTEDEGPLLVGKFEGEEKLADLKDRLGRVVRPSN